MRKFFLLLMLSVLTNYSFATTWDEPWADKVIKNASSFVFAKVLRNDDGKRVEISIIKTIAGKELKDSLWITGFSLLDMCSHSGGHGPRFNFEDDETCYFFLNEDSTGKFSIATPTTGYANLFEGKVAATYRHSYHMAAVPVDIYEKTMQAIFENYHGKAYDKTYITAFINENLSKKPAALTEEEAPLFFLQHVAMETIYHLQLSGYDQLLIPFLNDKTNFHAQVSAARALHCSTSTEAPNELLKIVADTSQSNFLQVVCIWSIKDLKPTGLKAELKKLRGNANDESNGFGGNIMDPRICTHFPSVKEALDELITKL
jgi:hypothetical protein